jgi:hypothetical protein
MQGGVGGSSHGHVGGYRVQECLPGEDLPGREILVNRRHNGLP